MSSEVITFPHIDAKRNYVGKGWIGLILLWKKITCIITTIFNLYVTGFLMENPQVLLLGWEAVSPVHADLWEEIEKRIPYPIDPLGGFEQEWMCIWNSARTLGLLRPILQRRAIGLLITISNQALGFMSHQQDYTTYSFNSQLLLSSLSFYCWWV